MDKVEELAPLLRYWDENDDTTSQASTGKSFQWHDCAIDAVRNTRRHLVPGRIQQRARASIRDIVSHDDQGLANTRLAMGDFPFYFVQLAPFRYKNQPTSALAEIWDAQLKTLKSVNNTGMVVTTDIGNIDDIHPTNKQEVGRRLALIALANTYQDQLPNGKQDLIESGPIYESMSTNQDQIRLTFDHVGEGLRKRFEDEELGDFTICGEDRKFVPANATIEGDVIIVSSPEVKQPIAVRFGWSDTAKPNLVNSAGLPASPFRTDDFPLESVDRSF